jgi:soluble lytic murein transglycosylase-like protein
MKTLIMFFMFVGVAEGNIDRVFRREERLHNLPANLLKAVCFVESNHNLKLKAVMDGRSHSWGLCQVKLAAAKQVGFKHSERLLAQHDINIRIAAKYLRYQLNRYRNDVKKGLTAYNRGSIVETTNLNNSYVRKVMLTWEKM